MAPLPSLVCSHGQGMTLCADRVPDNLRALLVEKGTCPNAGPHCSDCPAIGVVAGLLGPDGERKPDNQPLELALQDYGACVENAFGQLLKGPHLQEALQGCGLYMGMSTASAYYTEPARLFAKALDARLSLGDDLRDGIELALHEAVVNGLLHGNLDISSDGRDTLDGFSRYCDTISYRLAQGDLAGRLIEIFALWGKDHVDVAVVDSGKGYDLDALSISPDPSRKSGRGLTLIRQLAQSVTITDQGRHMTMRFAR